MKTSYEDRDAAMASVLIIDDDRAICRLLSEMVEQAGHQACALFSLNEALNEIAARLYDVVLLDVELPDGNGLEAIPKFRQTTSRPEVIIITGVGHPDGAEIAITNGAWDYIQKPLSVRKVILPLSRVLQYRDDLRVFRKPPVALKLEGIIGSGPRMQACFDSLARLATSETNVLITGETGTGKELFARALHANSPRADGNFVVVDCAALPDTLVESSLFGYQKGAFTGANVSHEGLVMHADGGSLFLDEVGELPYPLQSKFLRVLQERRFRPVGGKHETKSDFRLIAATNRDLDQMCREGRFRQDLLYRIRSSILDLPPLRQHREDIKELIAHYTNRICERYGIETKGFSPDFFEAVWAYEWPGNVRELVNSLEGMIAETRHVPTLYARHLPTNVRARLARASVKTSEKDPSADMPKEAGKAIEQLPTFREYRAKMLAKAERKYFRELMALTGGSIKEACTISGLGRTQLYTRLKKHRTSR